MSFLCAYVIHFVMSLHKANVSILHNKVIMLGKHKYIPFLYANITVLHYVNVIVYVCMQTCLMYVYMY